jgi:heme-degrading monooxygenase HmoA
MHARSGLLQVSPDQVDAAVAALKKQMPHYHEAKGFRGFTAMADRQTGRLLGISFWDTEADRDASEDLGAQARNSIQEVGPGDVEPVRETWEVVLEENT